MTTETIRTPIVPPVVSYYDLPGDSKLDLPSICSFVALGFFPGDSTYFTNRKSFLPATEYKFEQGALVSQRKYFQWHYQPTEQSFEQSLDEFTSLFNDVVTRQTAGKKVILPISGGLDSRSLAVAMQQRPKDVFSYSYEFEGGVPENRYGREVANVLGFPFESFRIPAGYLWSVIDQLAIVNGCYAEFINPRQMAIWGRLQERGDLFLLGHGGDLFFDGMGVPDRMSEEEQADHLVTKLVKPESSKLATLLWQHWGLAGSFHEHIHALIRSMLQALPIGNANARLRAFKTEYYVSRWTAVNLEVFRQQHPVAVPYFDDAMCQFVCRTPEEHLTGRRLQVEYVKKQSAGVATIPWQKYYPCNLYNYRHFNSVPVLFHRAWLKGLRHLREWMGQPGSMRNWELQFQGQSNRSHLETYILNGSGFVPKDIRQLYWNEFMKEPSALSLPITMLLTLSLFERHFLKSSS